MARGGDSTHLDVDRMIIDFLEYQAVGSVFNDFYRHRQAFDKSLETPPVLSHDKIQLVDSFLIIFKSKHPSKHLEPVSSFRLKLLQFSTVFVQRSVPNIAAPSAEALRALRTSSSSLSSTFTFGSPSSSPLRRDSADQLPVSDRHRIEYFQRMEEQGTTGQEPTLMDLQPLFLRLSAARSVLKGDERTIKETWMHFAGEFMLQAAMEQIMVHGATDTRALKEIFAWKWAGLNGIDEMFDGQEQEDIDQWENIRREWAIKLNPPSRSMSLGRHLLQVAAQYPLCQFERRMLQFLEACHNGITRPIFVQAQNGQIDGLTPEQTQTLLHRTGVTFD